MPDYVLCILYYIIGLLVMAAWAYYEGDKVLWRDVPWCMLFAFTWPIVVVLCICYFFAYRISPWWNKKKMKVLWKGRNVQ